MTFEFKFPDVGEGITEGRIVRWHVKEGDTIKADDVLCEVETDKAIVEIPSPKAGRILKRSVNDGDVIAVGAILVVIGDENESVREAMMQPAQPKKWLGVVGELEEAQDESSQAAARRVLTVPKEKSARALPSVRKLAASLGVELASLRPSGEGGIATQEDVLAATSKVGLVVKQPVSRPALKEARVVRKYDLYGYIDHVPFIGIRKRIAQKMQDANNKAAMVTHMDEADVTDIWALRQKEKVLAKEKGINLTLMPFIIKSIIAALKQFPVFASYIDEDAQEIIIKKYYNIGIAVDTPDGLLVPVIKGADQKALLELAYEIGELAKKTQDRKIDPGDLKGSSFTITNIGSIGGSYFTPILNFPEAAILGIARMQDKAVVKDGSIQVRKMLPLSLTFDHRIVDGAQAARFTNAIKDRLEDPDLLLFEME